MQPISEVLKDFSVVTVIKHVAVIKQGPPFPMERISIQGTCCDASFNFITTAPYTVYQFRVQAATRVGFGPFSPWREFAMLESGKKYNLSCPRRSLYAFSKP